MPKQRSTTATLKEGVSIILPTYKGEKWILKCLDSLARQTLNKKLFEVIIIINGEKDNSESLIDEFQQNHTDLEIIKIVLDQAGVSNARNEGLKKVSRQYTTFIDDDDWVSENYLEALYKSSSPGTFVVSRMINVDEDGKEEIKNTINLQIEKVMHKNDISFLDVGNALTVVCGKLLHTQIAKSVFFDTKLKNGEDVVYFSQLIILFDLKFKIANSSKYYRFLRNNSISRQKISYKFNILDRLSVIKRLNKLFFLTEDTEKIKFLKAMIIGQVHFIKNYIEQFPKKKKKAKREIGKRLFYYFPYYMIGIQTLEKFEEEKLTYQLNDVREKFRDVSAEKTKLLETVQQIPELKNQLNEASEKFRDVSTEKTKLLETVQQVTTLKKQLKQSQTQLNDTKTHLRLTKESLSYRLGHSLLHEKKKLINPRTAFRKIKTLKQVLNEKRSNNKKTIPTQANNSPALKQVSIKKIQEIKVALICDEFSYNSFKYEFDAITFNPDNWKDIFEENRPDLFLCESAWSGIDSKLRPWKGKIYSSINFKKENRIELLEILQYCKENNIPTVFWNKEDPTHYTDRVHDFVDTAKKFDYIFTTAEECIKMYTNEYKCKNVFCLPFATQPKLFNPIEKYKRSDAVIFAGSWYAQHKKRCVDMQKIFDAIIESGKELVIYDRHYGTEDTNHHFPKKYQSFVNPGVPHDQIDKVYKSSLFGLNINTVKNSPTMFARRVFELMSSNTFVLSNDSLGTKSFFKGNIIYLDQNPKLLSELRSSEIEKIRDENLHLVLEEHTYSKRFQDILGKIHFSYQKPDDRITIIMIANSEDEIEIILNTYENQTQIEKKLLIVLSEAISDIEIAQYYEKYNNETSSVVSLSHLKKYDNDWNSLITTPYFCILAQNCDFVENRLHKALLHTNYINEPIALDTEKKYSFSPTVKVQNILSQKSHFKDFLENYEQNIIGKFYHV